MSMSTLGSSLHLSDADAEGLHNSHASSARISAPASSKRLLRKTIACSMQDHQLTWQTWWYMGKTFSCCKLGVALPFLGQDILIRVPVISNRLLVCLHAY